MIHELQEGSQGESQHLTITEKLKNSVTRDQARKKACSSWIREKCHHVLLITQCGTWGSNKVYASTQIILLFCRKIFYFSWLQAQIKISSSKSLVLPPETHNHQDKYLATQRSKHISISEKKKREVNCPLNIGT